MKFNYFLMTALLSMALLCSCRPNSQEIEKDSADMLALAESLLNRPEKKAVTILEQEHYKQDADSINMYVLGSKLSAFIVLTIENDTVKAVELGKDHLTKSDALVTEKIWSVYTEKEAFNSVAVWTGMIADPDTTYYMSGSLMQTIQALLIQFSSYIPGNVLDEINEAMERDEKSFQLDLYQKDIETIDVIEEVAYKTDFELNFSNLVNLMEGIDVESASCSFREQEEGKKTYYRIRYRHALKEKLDISNMY